jgi:hypothetical protein
MTDPISPNISSETLEPPDDHRIVNRSGGINVNADSVRIKGDVIGHDKIESASGHIIHANIVIINDGQPIAPEKRLLEPLPNYDPRFTLESPQGAVSLDSLFYVERIADQELQRQIFGQRTTTTIRASRQSGKTSLLMRGIQAAKQKNQTIVYLDLQTIETAQRKTLNGLLQNLAKGIARQVGIDLTVVDKLWKSSLGALDKFNQLLEEHVLPSVDVCLLAIDEADQLLDTAYKADFFGMVRSWNSLGAFKPPWHKLNVVMIISTHPYLLIDNPYQSPFNVAISIDLKDFDETQVRELNSRHDGPIDPSKIGVAMELLGGHPYLIRQALYNLVSQQITWDGLARIATNDQGPFGRHLRFYLDELQKHPQLNKAMKSVVEQHKFSDETILRRLTAAGLLKEVAGQYVCRCGLYETYFKEKLR